MSALRSLLRKEVTEVLRDRRTLFFTFAMPLLLYPVLLAGTGMVIALGKDRLKHEVLSVAFTTPGAERLLGGALPERTLGRRLDRAEAEQALAAKEIAAAVEVSEASSAAVQDGGQALVTVLYTRRFDRSVEALDRLRPLVEGLNGSLLGARLEARNLEPGFATPLKLDPVDLDFDRNLGPLVASQLLPVTLLVWLLVGAMNSAVDLIAGEKERGTLETLLVSAVRTRDILLAKFLVVFGLAVASTLANLAAMAATFSVGVMELERGLSLTYSITLGQVCTLLLCLVPAALLLSGIAVAVASIARTQREGQTLMSPLILVGIAPALAVQMPGIELTPLTAAVPLLNVALLVKSVILQTATWPLVLETAGTVLVFSVLMLRVATRVFDSEFARLGGTGSLRLLFQSLWKS